MTSRDFGVKLTSPLWRHISSQISELPFRNDVTCLRTPSQHKVVITKLSGKNLLKYCTVLMAQNMWLHGVVSFLGELGSHLTQCGLGRGLPPYQVASSTIQPFGHNTLAEKCWDCCVPLWGGEVRSRSNTMWPGPRPTCNLHAKFHLDPSNRVATIQ